jgi:23S rRNA (adenine2503-C2)-methyltransferase
MVGLGGLMRGRPLYRPDSPARQTGRRASRIGVMNIDDIRQRLRALGAGPRHEAQVLRHWTNAKPQNSGKLAAEHFLPKALRAGLPAIADELAALATLRSEHPAGDGSARLLVTLGDGQTIESVLLPKDGLCVSSQVGCAVGCVFCMTGKEGLLRQLGSAEIVAQVALARSRRPVKKVVFMGMGEPSHNLDNVLDAIQLLGQEGGIGHKNLVFSTVGDARVFERLPLGRVKPALALSLHTTRQDLRTQLLPRAPRIEIEDLVERAEVYARATGYPIQYQWTLIDGVNDTAEDVDGIARLLAGKYAMMNLIPYNDVDGLDLRRPDWDRAVEMMRELNRRHVLTRLRYSAGQDVEGGCGQLRARVLSFELPVADAAAAAAVPTMRHIPIQPVMQG